MCQVFMYVDFACIPFSDAVVYMYVFGDGLPDKTHVLIVTLQGYCWSILRQIINFGHII